MVNDSNILLAVGALFGAALFLNFWLTKKRREALMKVAASLGMKFTARPGSGFLGRVAQFPLGNLGHSRGAFNLLEGLYQGAPIAVFDYTYTTGSGKNQTTHRQTVVQFSCDATVRIPVFTVRPENIFDKVATAFGCVDINFEHDEGFSRGYRLHGKDEQSVRLLFDDSVRNFLVRNPNLSMEGCPPGMILYRRGVCVEPAGLRVFLDRSLELFSFLARNAT